MQTSRLSERLEAAILEQVFSDDELENRVRGLLRWKIRFNAVDVAVVSGHVILSGGVISVLDRETAEQTVRKLRGVLGVSNCIATVPCFRAGQRQRSPWRFGGALYAADGAGMSDNQVCSKPWRAPPRQDMQRNLLQRSLGIGLLAALLQVGF